eukprot:6181999-Alexandrium_andersonii.AAC.1
MNSRWRLINSAFTALVRTSAGFFPPGRFSNSNTRSGLAPAPRAVRRPDAGRTQCLYGDIYR